MCTYLKITACVCSCFILVSIIIQSIVGYSYAIGALSNEWHVGHCSVVKSDTRIAKIFYNYMDDGKLYEGYINKTLLFNNKRIYSHNCKILTDALDKVLDIKLTHPLFEDKSSNNGDKSSNNDASMMQLIVFSVLLFGLLMMLCIIVSEMNEISMINNKIRIKKIATDVESCSSSAKPLAEQNSIKQSLIEPINLRKAGIVYPPEYNFENGHKSYNVVSTTNPFIDEFVDEFGKKINNHH